jgi:hypothetical protein
MSDIEPLNDSRRTAAALRVADYYAPGTDFGPDDERNRMAQALVELARALREG